MDINKIPRWFLTTVFIGTMSISGLMLKGAFAELDQNKKLVAKHELLIPKLSEDISAIKIGNETFRKEYREDQKDLDKKLEAISNLLRSSMR